jgi:hypothetical protein
MREAGEKALVELRRRGVPENEIKRLLLRRALEKAASGAPGAGKRQAKPDKPGRGRKGKAFRDGRV